MNGGGGMQRPKRKASEMQLVATKKPRNEITVHGDADSGVPRTSNLEAPIMLLSGHEGEIFSAKFHPDGQFIASAGFDRQIFLWNVYGECENFGVLKGHSGAIIEINFTTDGTSLVTCSTDKNVSIWDMETGQRTRRLKGHTSFVNSCCPTRRGNNYLVSGSDDGTIRIWDPRKPSAVQTFQNIYQVTAVVYNDTGEQVYTAGIDNDIKAWDLRKNDVVYKMRGHTDTVTSLSLSPDGSYLLTNSMDNTVRSYDVRPYAPQERCCKIFQGIQHNFEKNLLKCSWSADGKKVSAGSADRFVYIWDADTRQILYKLPGHAGSVNEVAFHPHEPIVMSCSSDKNIFLGEILQ